MRSRSLLAVLTLCVASAAVAPRTALAEKRRVAVLSVEGARNGKLERSLRRLVKGDNVVVSNKVYRKAARRLRARQLNAQDVAEVARYLEVDGVLEGTLHPGRDGYKLTLRLREGANGRPVKTYVIPVRGNRFSERNANRLRSKLEDEIASLEEIAGVKRGKASKRRAADEPSPAAADDDEGEEDYEEEDYEEEDYEEEEPLDAEPEPEPRQDEAAFESDRVSDVPDEEEVAVASASAEPKDWTQDGFGADLSKSNDRGRDPYSRVVGFNASGGASFVARTISFSSAAAVADQVSEYSPVASPGVFVNGELFPLAVLSQDDTLLNNLGFGFRYEQALGFNSPVAAADGGQILLPTGRRSYAVDVRYRLLLGERDSSPTITIGAGYNKRDYAIDTTPLDGSGLSIDLPDVSYTYIDPRVSLLWPMSKKLAFGMSGAFLAVIDAGDMTKPETYGTALITGGDADAYLRYRITDRISVSVGAMATAIAYDFNADGELSANRDMDDTTEDVAGALDLYMGGYLTAGYAY